MCKLFFSKNDLNRLHIIQNLKIANERKQKLKMKRIFAVVVLLTQSTGKQ